MLTKNLFAEKKHLFLKTEIENQFDEFNYVTHDNIYSLSEFIFNSPNKYYSIESFEIVNTYLETLAASSNFSILLNAINENLYELNHAIRLLDGLNFKNIHEYKLPEEEIEKISYLNNTILYEYLKVSDVILMGLLRPLAHCKRAISKKGVEKLDVFNCVQTLSTDKDFEAVLCNYDNTVRNAIAHGGIVFEGNNIIFKDKKNTISLSSWSFTRKFDDLIDLVNGLDLAYKKFYLLNFEILIKNNILIPDSIKEIELRIKSEHFGWKIMHSYESIIQHGKQYNILIQTSLNSRDFINMSAYHTAYYLEKLFPQKYSTLFIHIKTKFKLPCWQSFNMLKFRDYIASGKIQIVTDGPFLFERKKFAKKLDYIQVYRKGVFFKGNKKKLECKYIKFHSKKFYNVIEKCSMYLNPENVGNVEDYIRNHCRTILSKTIRFKNSKSSFLSSEYIFPTKYIRVFIYTKEYRERKYADISKDKFLVAILYYNTSKQIKKIIPNFGIKENTKHCLIIWNKES